MKKNVFNMTTMSTSQFGSFYIYPKISGQSLTDYLSAENLDFSNGWTIVLRLNQAFLQGIFYSFNTDNWYVHSDGQHISFSSTDQNRFALVSGQYLVGLVFYKLDQLQEPISVDSTFIYLGEWKNTECFSESEHAALRYGTLQKSNLDVFENSATVTTNDSGFMGLYQMFLANDEGMTETTVSPTSITLTSPSTTTETITTVQPNFYQKFFVTVIE